MTKHEIEIELLAVVAFIWLAFATLLWLVTKLEIIADWRIIKNGFREVLGL